MSAEEFKDKYLSQSDALYKVAYYILESQEEAYDALQELYLKLWQKRATLKGIIEPQAYCTTLLKNICIDRIRRQSVNGGEAIESQYIMSQDDAQDDVLNAKQKLDMVRAAMRRLTPGEYTVLQLKVFEGMDYQQISRQTGMGEVSLRVLLSNARRKIKAIVEERVSKNNRVNR